MEATALQARGWSVSAIARHLGRDRKTVRAYLAGKRTAGERKAPWPDPFDRLAPYVAQRLADDPHVWASALFDEAVRLGYPLSYASFTRSLRRRALRPHCEACAGVKGRETIEVPHPPGAEVQCGVPHSTSYVARVNMWRGSRKGCVGAAQGAATG
jgi:transcriptional regulator with XRE-family HTH domain